MKPFKALISKNTIHRAHVKEAWPNPYNLTKEDAKDHVKGWPLEVITLALLESKKKIKSYTIKDLQNSGVSSMFSWDNTSDGWDFWHEMDNERFNMFYDRYTPEKLKEKLKYETP